MSNLHASFDVAWDDTTGLVGPFNGTDAIRVALGPYGGSSTLVLNSTARRFVTVELENDGELDGFSGTTQLTPGVPVSVDLFANDSDADTNPNSHPVKRRDSVPAYRFLGLLGVLGLACTSVAANGATDCGN